MIEDDFIKFLVKICLLFAAGLVPLMLGGKIASSISGQIQSLTKKMRENSFSRSRGAQSLERRANRKGDKAEKAADKREVAGVEAKQGLLARALNSKRLENEKERPGLRGAAARYASDKGWGKMDQYDLRRGQLKSGLAKDYGQASEVAEKQPKIDSLVGKYGRIKTDASGNQIMRTHDGDGAPLSSPVPEYELDPRKIPQLMRDPKGQQDALALHAAGLADDNTTGRERVVRDIAGAMLGRNDNVGIEAASGSGPHNYWNVHALASNATAVMGMGSSKIGKADFKGVSGWQSNTVPLMGEDIKEITLRGQQAGGMDVPIFRGTNSETGKTDYYSANDAIGRLRGAVRKRFASTEQIEADFHPDHVTPRIVATYDKLMDHSNPIFDSFTNEEVMRINDRISDYKRTH